MPLDIVSHVELPVTSTDVTIGDLKRRIERRLRTPARLQTLCFRGQELEDGLTISHYHLKLDSTLMLVVKGGGDPDEHKAKESFHEEDQEEEEQEHAPTKQANGHGFADSMPFSHYIGNDYYYGGYAMKNNMQGIEWGCINYWEPVHNTDMTTSLVTIHVFWSGSAIVATTVDLNWTDTVLHLKREVHHILGHNIASQKLNVSGPDLDDHSQLIQILEILEDPVV